MIQTPEQFQRVNEARGRSIEAIINLNLEISNAKRAIAEHEVRLELNLKDVVSLTNEINEYSKLQSEDLKNV